MFGLPVTTNYDVKFPVLGIPVRVNPFFWALAAYLGWNTHEGALIAVWMVAVFVSILVHELGHGLAARHLAGQQPAIVLYHLGGFCLYGEVGSPWRRLGVILMGPLAGLGLYALVTALAAGVLGFALNPLVFVPTELLNILNLPPIEPGLVFHRPPDWFLSNQKLAEVILIAYRDFSIINFYWSVLNLLPIYPLDGGQVAMTLFTMRSGGQGARNCHIISIGFGAIVAVYFAQRDQYYNAILFGLLVWSNIQALQMLSLRSRFSGGSDDDQWWRQ